jgi:predicted type IV restriction endonuclease
MKTRIFAFLTAVVISASAGAADNLTDAIETVRATYKADRQVFVAEHLQLTETESAAFWPLYRSYRVEMEKIGDGLVKLMLEYADLYPNVPEGQAKKLLQQYTSLEKKLVDKRVWYLKRAGKVLPATKVLRWAQLENQLDLALRLQLVSAVPLVPEPESRP